MRTYIRTATFGNPIDINYGFGSIVIKLNGPVDNSYLIDWKQIILYASDGITQIEYDIIVNPVFNFHSQNDVNWLISSYPNNPLHVDGTPPGGSSGRLIWYFDANVINPAIEGDTLLTLFPKAQVGSMKFDQGGDVLGIRNVALETTYNGETYNTPKTRMTTTFI